MLTLLKEKVEKHKYGWKGLYRCECGREKLIFNQNVKRGATKSCGCMQRKAAARASTTHGMMNTRTYTIWQGMKGRCLVKSNGSYKKYGETGIGICDEWLSFENFLKDMGECPDGLTIDRIDGSKGYSKDNCRWATYQDQAFNRRLPKNNTSGCKGVSWRSDRNKYQARITFNGKTISLGFFSDIADAIKARGEAESELLGNH